MTRKFGKSIIMAFSLALVTILLAGAGPSWAFSVDLKHLYYKDYADPATVGRIVDYDFSGGTLASNTIAIPDSYVTKSAADAGLSFTFGPYPAPNDIVLALDTAGLKSTLTSAAEGGAVLNTTGIPNPPMASLQWEWAVQLTGFSGLTDPALQYRAQIGFGSPTPGPHPEMSAGFITGAAGRELVVTADIYDDVTDQTLWFRSTAPIPGLDPAASVIDLRVYTVPIAPGAIDMVFEYRVNSAGAWTSLGTYEVRAPQDPFWGFPTTYPFLSLRAEGSSGGPTISFTGAAASGGPDYPATGIDGVLVELADNAGTNTTTAGGGGFVLNGISAGQNFSLKLTKSGYTPVYSAIYNWNQNIVAQLAYGLFPDGQLATWGVTAGNGMIFGRVSQTGNPTGYLDGAVVTAVNAGNTGITYPVEYLQDNGTFGGTQTTASGSYAVRNVTGGTVVKLDVAKAGYQFPIATSYAMAVAGAMTEESFFGAPSGITFTGKLTGNDNFTPIAGAAVHMVGNPAVTTTTAVDGSFTLTGLPSGTPFSLRMTQTGYTDTFTANFTTTAPIDGTGRPYNLFPAGQLTTWGVTPGTGIIRSRILDTAGFPLAGAVVTAVNQAATPYPVCYDDACTPGLSSTAIDGRYVVKNVADGDTVTITAVRAGVTFSPRAFLVHAGGLSQGSLLAVSGTPTGITFKGKVTDASNPPVNLAGVLVHPVGTPANMTITVGDGTFALTGLPSGSPFSMKMAKVGFADTYSANITTATSIDGIASPFVLFTTAQYGSWSVAAGRGIVRSRVTDQAGVNKIAGAVVTAVSGLGNTYAVCYDNACTGTLTATQADGLYIIRDVWDVDTVTVTAQKASTTFNTRVFTTHVGGVSEGRITGTADGGGEQAAVEAGLASAMTAYNAKNLTGFMAFVSDNFLDKGTDKAGFQTMIAAEMAKDPFAARTYVIQTTTVIDTWASIQLIWNGVENDTLFFIKEGVDWKLYGDQALFSSFTSSGWTPNAGVDVAYWVNIGVEDPQGIVTKVHVTGPGLAGEGIDLNHDTVKKRWVSFAAAPGQTDLNPKFGTTRPALPLGYVLTIDYASVGGPAQSIQNLIVNGFQETAYAQNVSPADGASIQGSAGLVFTWDALAAGYTMGIEVEDATTGQRLWEVYKLTGTSKAYDGPGLADGSYRYYLTVRGADENYSLVSTNFTVATPTVIVNYPRTQVTDNTADDDHPDWKPDGTRIVFDSNRSGNYNIWAINPDGTGITQLTHHTGYVQARFPSFSPDGTTIAYLVADEDPSYGGFGRFYLYTMAGDGSNGTLRPLPPGTGQTAGDTWWEFEMKFTAWADASSVIFVSFGPNGGSFKIYRYDLTASVVSEITPADEANSFGDIFKISWNADANLLAYDRWPIGVQTFTPGVANYKMMNIPRASQMDTPAHPGWNPEGTRMAFVKDVYSASSNIAIFDWASPLTTINQSVEGDRWPVWSPAGTHMAIVSGVQSPPNGSIWLLTLEAAKPGDLNGDGVVNLPDAVLALKVVAGMNPTGIRENYAASGADVNGDGKVGLAEIAYILQKVSSLR